MIKILLHTGLVILFFSQLSAQTQSIDNLKKNALPSTQRILSEKAGTRDQQQFRNAQNYINLNQYHMAIPLLKDLVRRNPDNFSYYDWLLRCFFLTADIDQADSLVSFMQQRHPDDPNYLIDQANVLYRRDQKEAALRRWNEILRASSADINIYQRVASAMVDNRLLDEAIKVYLQAIHTIPRSENFYLSIAELYRSRLMFSEATHYYLKYLQKIPSQQSFVFNQILSFQIEPEQRPKFFQTLENSMRQDSLAATIKLLTAQLYQRYGEFEKAFLVYQEMDDPRTEGSQMLQFAQAAERDSSFEVALRAYRYLIRKYPQSRQVIAAYSGAISTLFHLAVQNSHQPSAQLALRMMDTVNYRFPQHPEINYLNYLQGNFYLDFYFDIDKAIEIFSLIVDNKKAEQKLKEESLLQLGQCYLMKGNIPQAMQVYKKVVQAPFRAQALYGIAQAYFFQTQWDECQKTIENLLQTQGLASWVANDALALQMVLHLSKETPDIIQKFSEAEFLRVQHKKSEAVKKYKEIIESGKSPAAIRAKVYLTISRLSLELQEPLVALDYCHRAIQDSLIQLYADEHLFLMGAILERSLNRPQDAFNAYKQLLQSYPNSLLAEEARDRLKHIRQQPNFEIP